MSNFADKKRTWFSYADIERQHTERYPYCRPKGVCQAGLPEGLHAEHRGAGRSGRRQSV